MPVRDQRKDFLYHALGPLDRSALPTRGAEYVPIATVAGAQGRELGDAAGLIEFPGGGRIHYIAGILLADPTTGPACIDAALRFLAATARK